MLKKLYISRCRINISNVTKFTVSFILFRSVSRQLTGAWPYSHCIDWNRSQSLFILLVLWWIRRASEGDNAGSRLGT